MSHAWRGANRMPLREEQMRPFVWNVVTAPQCRPRPPTARQLEALRLRRIGLSYSEIGREMGVDMSRAFELVVVGERREKVVG